jgi:glucosamine--fructose-6-phosphate aminotransferase (isomerizing)
LRQSEGCAVNSGKRVAPLDGKGKHLSTQRQFPHAMLREIYEQPDALRRTLDAYIEGNALREAPFACALEALTGRHNLLISASGSSRHAGLIGEVLFEDFAGLPVDVEYASEYIYRSTQTMAAPCFLVLSQSGETADTLEALREAKSRGASTIAITNHEHSSMAHLAQCSLPTKAGQETAIPSTKSFTTQLLVLNLLALFAARVRGRMTRAVIEKQLADLEQLPALMEQALPEWESTIADLARKVLGPQTFLFLGRGIHYPIAREGALKMKESAYVHAEGYPTGELKHGPNALVSNATIVLVLATHDSASPDSMLRYYSTVRLLKDLKQQGATVIAIATKGDTVVPSESQHTIFVPSCPEHLAPMLEVVPLQLFAYFAAVERGIDVDRPRNLTKAVLNA